MKIKTKNLIFTRADVVPDSFNENENTVDIVLSTGQKGLRTGFFSDPYYEELEISNEAVSLDWLNSGKAPFLDSHNSYSTDSQLGVFISARIEDEKIIGTVKFSKRDSIKEKIQDIKDGILKNVSAGYRVEKYKVINKEDSNEKYDTYRAVSWTPLEGSLVTIPFDKSAEIRSAENFYEIEIIKTRDETMSKKTENTQKEDGVEKVEIKLDEAKIRKDELKRFADINDLVLRSGIDKEVSTEMFQRGISIDEARKEVLDILVEKSNHETNNSQVEVSESNERKHFIRGAEDAILNRSNSAKYKITDEAKDFKYMSLIDIAKESLAINSIKTRGLDPTEIVKRAFLSTSDFPLLLSNVLNKSLLAGYESLPKTFEPFIKMRPMADFKLHPAMQVGPAPELLLKKENSEIKAGAINENSESYKLETYARKILISRETIINDDLSALTSTPESLASRIADKENDLFWSLVTTPQTMSDSLPLFDAGHNNIGAGAGAPSVATLSEARKLARKQKDIDGVRPINIMLDYLVVSTTDETTADQLVTNVQGQTFSPATTGTINPFVNRLQVVVEPRLDVTAGAQPFYVFGSASKYPMVEKGFLQGQESGPQSSSYVDNDTKGIAFDILYDVVFHAVDFRAMIKMPGV